VGFGTTAVIAVSRAAIKWTTVTGIVFYTVEFNFFYDHFVTPVLLV
jgi:hypothetical protein